MSFLSSDMNISSHIDSPWKILFWLEKIILQGMAVSLRYKPNQVRAHLFWDTLYYYPARSFISPFYPLEQHVQPLNRDPETQISNLARDIAEST